MLGGDGRKKNGGARAGAGRKAGLPNSSTLEFRNYVRQYTKEAVDMFVAGTLPMLSARSVAGPRRTQITQRGPAGRARTAGCLYSSRAPRLPGTCKQAEGLCFLWKSNNFSAI
jgi:hypothetical protein